MSGPPYKCPDCGVWWAGLEHRCRVIFRTTTMPPVTYTDKCNCVYDDHGNRIPQTAPCPFHDTTTYIVRNTP